MEVKKRSGEKRGGVKVGFGGLGGGGGGLVLVVGGAILAATLWSFCEFRRRRKPGFKKGTLKDFQTPNLEKVKNVDGRNGLGVILQNSNQTEEKDTSALNLLLDVGKGSKLGIIEEDEEEVQEGNTIEGDECIDGNLILLQKEDEVACEAVSVHETMHEGEKFWVDSMDADAASSVSDDDSSVSEEEVTASENDGIKNVEKVEVGQFATPESVDDSGVTCEKKGDADFQNVNLYKVVDDGSNDAVSEHIEYEREDDSEGSSRGTFDSTAESNAEAVWQVKSSEALSQSIKGEEILTSFQTEIVETKDIKTVSSVNSTQNEIVEVEACKSSSNAIHFNEIVDTEDSVPISSTNGTHHHESFDDNVSIDKEMLVSKSKVQTEAHLTNVRIRNVTILLALLVLLGALLAQHKHFSPALANIVSSLNAFLTL